MKHATDGVLLVIFVGLAIIGHNVLAQERDIPSYYRSITEATRQTNVVQMLTILTELDSARVWSFGAGLGPVDAEALQVTALEAFAVYLLDKTGQFKGNDDIVGVQNRDRRYLRWLHNLNVKTNDVAGLHALLEDNNPSVRWLGLKKVELLTRPDDIIMNKVRVIVLQDPYVRIFRQTTISTDDRPTPPGATVNEFSCPLREIAARILRKWGVTFTVDVEAVGRRGVDYLVTLYEKEEKKRSAIVGAVKLLNPKGPGMSVLKQESDKSQASSAASLCREVKSKSKQ